MTPLLSAFAGFVLGALVAIQSGASWRDRPSRIAQDARTAPRTPSGSADPAEHDDARMHERAELPGPRFPGDTLSW